MNGQQLKNSILQLAIQGKLVPQDSNDEPASALLSQIREEKKKLVEEKKIKKDKPLAPIKDEEKPFEIPDSWEWVRLGEIALDSADGPFGSNLKKEHYTNNEEVRIIQLSNIGDLGWRDNNKKYTTYSHLETIKRSEAFPGDIIIAKMMPAGRAIICPNEDKKYVLSSDAVRFEFTKQLFKLYIYWSINSPIFRNQVYGNVQGITRVRTSLTKLREYVVPLPPLSEQHRIVEKIEELLPLVEEYDEAQTKLDKLNNELPEKLKNSVLQQAIMGRLDTRNDKDEPASELLARIREEKKKLVEEKKIKKDKPLAPIKDEEKPFEIPESWEWVRLGEVTNLYIGKTPERGNASFWSDNDYPWISISDMTEYGHIKTTKESISKKAAVSCFKRISHVGSLIMSFKLTVGRTSIIDIDAFHNEAIVTIERYCDDNNYIRHYLFYLLPLLSNMGDSKDAIKGKTLNSTSLNNLIIPLPPLAEQHRIVEKIEELLTMIERLKLI